MEVAVIVFLSSGLFLGWSLGANDAANVFGTAVGSRMVRFTTAAIVCSAFVILGAVISGAGPVHTLGKLGSVNAISGAFMVALSAASAVFMMTRAGLPVSTTQAIVGAIVGWNVFSGSLTDTETLLTLAATWLISPILAAVIAAGLYKAITAGVRAAKPHLLRLDAYTRAGLIVAGAFGAYSLGANNVANVMGVFVPVSPFTALRLGDFAVASSAQQLFLIGGIAIAVGVFTYSKRVMMTVGRDLAPLSPIGAFVVVVAHSLVLFLFASQGLETALARAGLPTIPLVPVSSSQAVIGAVIGMGLLKGWRGIRFRLFGGVAVGWVVTPILAGVMCFVGLFVLKNVFDQSVYRAVAYQLSEPVLERLEAEGIETSRVRDLTGARVVSSVRFRDRIEERAELADGALRAYLRIAEIDRIEIDGARIASLGEGLLTDGQRAALEKLAGRRFTHRWMLDDALAEASDEWKPRRDTKLDRLFNRRLDEKRQAIYQAFRVEPD